MFCWLCRTNVMCLHVDCFESLGLCDMLSHPSASAHMEVPCAMETCNEAESA